MQKFAPFYLISAANFTTWRRLLMEAVFGFTNSSAFALKTWISREAQSSFGKERERRIEQHSFRKHALMNFVRSFESRVWYGVAIAEMVLLESSLHWMRNRRMLVRNWRGTGSGHHAN